MKKKLNLKETLAREVKLKKEWDSLMQIVHGNDFSFAHSSSTYLKMRTLLERIKRAEFRGAKLRIVAYPLLKSLFDYVLEEIKGDEIIAAAASKKKKKAPEIQVKPITLKNKKKKPEKWEKPSKPAPPPKKVLKDGVDPKTRPARRRK